MRRSPPRKPARQPVGLLVITGLENGLIKLVAMGVGEIPPMLPSWGKGDEPVKAELLEQQEKHERETRRLGRRALKERQNEEWLKELQAAGIAEKLLDRLTADQLEAIGKTHARRARKEQKRAEICFTLVRAKRREVTNGKN
ncbi:hypothetical protein ES708_29372 [subsurface metagenome]